MRNSTCTAAIIFDIRDQKRLTQERVQYVQKHFCGFSCHCWSQDSPVLSAAVWGVQVQLKVLPFTLVEKEEVSSACVHVPAWNGSRVTLKLVK